MTTPATVLCCCGCRQRVLKSEAVGVNGRWAIVAHLSKALDRTVPKPRQIELLLRGGQ